jgi:hypothetical protein
VENLSLSVAQRRFLHRERQNEGRCKLNCEEWGNAEQASLTRMTECMFDFRLSDDGQLGRDIQKQPCPPSVVVDRIVKRIARKRLKSKEGGGKKTN